MIQNYGFMHQAMSKTKRNGKLEFRKSRKEREKGRVRVRGDCRKASGDSKGRRGEGGTWADNRYVE